jgi:hypothetical protein
VIPLPRLSPCRHQRIRRLSNFLKFVSIAAMILSLGILLSAWILPVVMIGPRESSQVATKQTPDSDQNRFYLNLAGPGLAVYVEQRSITDMGVSGIRPDRESLARRLVTLHAAWWALGCWTLLRLFQNYGSGNILTAESAQRLKHVGLWMIGDWVECHLFQLSKIWLTWLIPTDSFQLYFGGITFAGLFICLIAWIMEEAHLIAEEQSLTV